MIGISFKAQLQPDRSFALEIDSFLVVNVCGEVRSHSAARLEWLVWCTCNPPCYRPIIRPDETREEGEID